MVSASHSGQRARQDFANWLTQAVAQRHARAGTVTHRRRRPARRRGLPHLAFFVQSAVAELLLKGREKPFGEGQPRRHDGSLPEATREPAGITSDVQSRSAEQCRGTHSSAARSGSRLDRRTSRRVSAWFPVIAVPQVPHSLGRRRMRAPGLPRGTELLDRLMLSTHDADFPT
jgi:hypothetical protein